MRADQLIADQRMRLMAVVEAAPSIREGCRRVGMHHSTYYAWLSRLERNGIEGLTPPSARTRVKTATRIRYEAEVVALALANPAWGPQQLCSQLRLRGIEAGSASQVWRILVNHRLNTRQRRYRLIAATQGLAVAETEGPSRSRSWVGKLDAEKPGDLIQLDCFHIGRLKEARLGDRKIPGMVWQYTAIDVASSFTWAQLHTTAHNPSAIHTTALAMRVADDLARWGYEWNRASTDRGNEFVDHRFTDTLADLGVEHRYIKPGRPQSNGKVEQVQNTILQECWKPALISYVEPSITGLKQDLEDFLDYYNNRRPHHGRWNQGDPPATIIANTGNQP
ncbi:MAG: integrase core domain-containing protein [Acidimicrobiia bacterium]